MSVERIDSFKQRFLAIRDRLLEERLRDLNGYHVADVIFFPEFLHTPMIRIDGSNVPSDQVADLEGRAIEFLVREEEYAGIVNTEVLGFLKRSGFLIDTERYSTNKWNDELMSLAKEFFKQLNFSVQGYRVWEIEMHDYDVVIRLTGDASAKKELTFGDDVRIDILPDYHWEELDALLGFYDYCKTKKKPFLRTLQEHMLHSQS